MIQRSVNMLKRFWHPRPNLSRYGTVSKKMYTDLDNIVWMDLEMTGLDIDTCDILEVGCFVTDSRLRVISGEFNVVIHQPDEVLENMNEWCMIHHQKTGLTEASRKSLISLAKAEQSLLEFVKSYSPPGKCPLAGNSIYMDRLFLAKYMPSVNDYLHYRIIDVSTIKELTRRWNSEAFKNAPTKNLAHRAVDDIKDSLRELQYYRQNMFKTSD